MRQNIFHGGPKRIGSMQIDSKSVQIINADAYKSYIKIVFLPKGIRVRIDFGTHVTTGPTLGFISPEQVFRIGELLEEPGYLIYYNRDFYCIQLNDEEVACDGLLFSHVNHMRLTTIPEEQAHFINYLIKQIENEFAVQDPTQEEMLRTYLKQLLIKSTRIWRQQHLTEGVRQQNNDLDFFRKFMQLVETFYKEKHSVADYADMLSVAPKTLTHKFKRLHLPQPNEVIKNRIILEGKRLLCHTRMTVKEVAYQLGYEDPAYFSRFFFIKTNHSPSDFRDSYFVLHKPK